MMDPAPLSAAVPFAPHRWRGAWLALALALPALVYFPITGNFFVSDDFLHLYNIANKDLLDFLLRMHGGHLLMTRNAIFLLFFDAFGTHVAAYFWVVLATHLFNVFLMFRIICALTGSVRLAAFGSALWGVLPVQQGALGWYSVYGHVLVATSTLLVLCALTRAAAGAPPHRWAPLLWTLLLLAGATSFGVGIGVACVMPLVALLLLPASTLRTQTLLAFSALAVSIPFLYFRLESLYVELYGGMPPSFMLMAGLYDWHEHAAVLAHLIGYGICCVALGVFQHPSFYPGPVGYAVVGGYAAILLAAFASASAAVRRRILACVAICPGAYAVVAVGRGIFAGSMGAASLAMSPRFHYVGTAALAIVTCLALAQIAQRWRWKVATGTVLLLVWAGLTIVGWQLLGAPIRHFDAARWETTWMLGQIRRAAQLAPPGGEVYVENQVFTSVGMMLLKQPEVLPGWAALYTIYFPDAFVDGRRIWFVEDDPRVIAAVRQHRRTAALLVAPEDARADIYHPPAAWAQPGAPEPDWPK